MNSSQNQLKQLACQRLTEVYTIANAAFEKSFSLPEVLFNLKGKTAGYAYPAENKIRINYNMMLANGENFVRDVIGHEAAHLISYKIYGLNIKPHGKEWKNIMRLFDCQPKACHRYKVVDQQKRQKFTYQCNCRVLELSVVRHRRIVRGEKYLCAKCKAELKQVTAKQTIPSENIYLYKCLCLQPKQLTETQHFKAVNGSRYMCKVCRHLLTPQI